MRFSKSSLKLAVLAFFASLPALAGQEASGVAPGGDSTASSSVTPAAPAKSVDSPGGSGGEMPSASQGKVSPAETPVPAGETPPAPSVPSALKKEGTPPSAPAVSVPRIGSRILSESDELGRSLRITFLDAEGNPVSVGRLNSQMERKTLGASGFASVQFTYLGQGENEAPVLWEFFDKDGKPVLTSQGYSSITMEFNPEGREIKRSYLGLDNNPVENKYGFATVRRTYDGTRRLTREAYYGKDDKLAVNTRTGYAVAQIEYVNNDKEEYEARTFLDAQANPLKIDGAFKHVKGVSRGKEALTVLLSYNNLDDSLMNGAAGYALHISRPINGAENPKEAFLDEKGVVVNGPSGYATLVLDRDKDSGREKLQYLDAKGNPVNNPELKWSYRTFTRDAQGNPENSLYYDKDGKRVLVNEAID